MPRRDRTILRNTVAATLASCILMLHPAPVSGRESDRQQALQEELSIIDALDSYVFEARQAESTARRTAGYLEAAMARLEKASGELTKARGEFETASARLRDTLRMARLGGGSGVFESMFIPETNLESARRQALLGKLASTQAEDLARMAAAHEKAVAMEFVAGMERAQAWVLARTSEEALRNLEKETTARRKLLEKLNSDLKTYRKHAAEMSQAERDMVRTIEARLSSRTTPVNFDDHKGMMPMPLVDGTVQVPFGDVVHPRFKTVTPHPGWTLTYDSRGPRNVRSIAFGRIVWTGRMRGFGSTIVVDHASGWYSIYGGLTGIKVKEGSIVRQGDVIAQVEAAPGDRTLSMYFELRRGSVAIDPADYVAATIRRESSR